MKNLTDFVALLKGLMADKSGTFILGVIVPIIPCYFIVSSQNKEINSHAIQIEKQQKREDYWKSQYDSCQFELKTTYYEAYNSGRNSVREQLDVTLQMIEDVQSSLSKKEQNLRKKIDKTKKEIQK